MTERKAHTMNEFDDKIIQAHFNTWVKKKDRNLTLLDAFIEAARFQWQLDQQVKAESPASPEVDWIIKGKYINMAVDKDGNWTTGDDARRFKSKQEADAYITEHKQPHLVAVEAASLTLTTTDERGK